MIVIAYFRLENWYPDIKEYTFATKWEEMTMAEALALKKYSELLRQLLVYRDLQAKRRNVGQWESTGILSFFYLFNYYHNN